jgi:hypothetical protein
MNRHFILQKILTAWWGFPYSESLISNDELEQIENKLQIRLPADLLNWYSLVGKKAYLFISLHFLLPDQLKIRNGFLEFCNDGNGDVFWGIRRTDLTQENPVVTLTYDDYIGHLEEVGTLDTFILNAAIWDTFFYKSSLNVLSGTSTEITMLTINNHFLSVGRANTYPPLELQLFCSDLGIMWINVDTGVLFFYGFEPIDIEKAKKIIDAEWDNLV